MKITPGQNQLQSSPPVAEGKAKQTKTEDTTKKTASASTVKAQTQTLRMQMHHWFKRIGVDVAQLHSPKTERELLVRRREDLKALKRLENLAKIASMAGDIAVSQPEESTVDPDWFYEFVELAETIHSPKMQELWSKILAVEFSRPGSFSLKTLKTLKLLTHREAQIFSCACRLACKRQGDPIPRIILHFHQKRTLSRWLFPPRSIPVNLALHGLSYPSVLTLIDLGLIMPSEIESGEFPTGKDVQFRCGDRQFLLSATSSGNALVYYKFSAVGAELFRLTLRQENSAYLDELKTSLSAGFSMT